MTVIPGVGRFAQAVQNDVMTSCEMAAGTAPVIADGTYPELYDPGGEEDQWIRRRVDELEAVASTDDQRRLLALVRADLAARDEILRLADLTRRGEFPA